MPESLRTRVMRWGFNFFPVYRRAGGRIVYLADDMREVRVAVPLNWSTRNYVGTIYGGAMYGAVDPLYMLMLIKNLGSEFVVWDKAASIRYRHPGRDTLFATCAVDDAELDEIRRLVARAEDHKIERHYTIDLVNKTGVVHATVDKTVSIRKKGNP